MINKMTLSVLFSVLTIVGTKAQNTNTLWAEDFEGNWTADWHVDAGTWEAGTPTSGPSSAFRGNSCAATVLAGNYAEPVETRLIRHTSFAVPPASENPRLRFWHWYSFSAADHGIVQIKPSGAAEWVDISDQYIHTGSAAWSYPSLDLSDYAGQTVQVAFYFSSTNNGGGLSDVSSGWYIDDVQVVSGPVMFNNPEDWENGIGDWYVEAGTWEVGTPTSGPGTPYRGDQCAATVLEGNYAEPVETRLTSPSFAVPPASENPRLRFWHWYNFSAADHGIVQIKIEGTNDWIDISNPFTGTSSDSWSYTYFSLSNYVGLRVQVAFYFYSVNNAGGLSDVSSGWYVDDVILEDDSGLEVDAGPDRTINKGVSATLDASVSGGTQPYVFEWIPAAGLSDPALLNPVATPSDTTIYTLKVTDDNGAFRTDKVHVFVNTAANDILSYTVGTPPQTGESVINTDNHTVDIEVAYGTDVSSLIATFELSQGATAKVNGAIQQSGTTSNDFTEPVTYTISAEDGITSQEWVVSVNVAPNDQTDILAFGFGTPPQSGEPIIDTDAHTVHIEVEYGTDVTELVATFTLSDGATATTAGVAQESSVTANNFTDPLTYVIQAEDGVTTQDWIITVAVAPNDATDILSFGFGQPPQNGDAVLNPATHTIAVEVAYGTDLSMLVPNFTLSEGATAKVGALVQKSGVTQNDFTNPVTYTVTAEDAVTTQDWIVTVTAIQTANDETDILSFAISAEYQRGDAYIDPEAHVVYIDVMYTAPITALKATFTLSDGATASVEGDIQHSGITLNDFTDAVPYLITAQDGFTTQEWTVTVAKITGLTPNSMAVLNTFPNPFTDQAIVEFSNDDQSEYHVSIYSPSGAKVLEMRNIRAEKVTIERGNLPSGTYLMVLWNKKGARCKRIVIQ